MGLRTPFGSNERRDSGGTLNDLFEKIFEAKDGSMKSGGKRKRRFKVKELLNL